MRPILASLCLFAFFRAAVFAQSPLPPLQAGLCVVFPASSAADFIARGPEGNVVLRGAVPVLSRDLIALSREGNVLVHALTPDAAQAEKLRKDIAAEGRSGQVSVMVWNKSGELPYADDLVDELVIDLDALGANRPTPTEINRVLVPEFGVARLRSGGVWKDHVRPMPETYGEWTHYYHDATSNPVGTDRVATVATGVRWLAESQAGGGSYQLVGNGRLAHITGVNRSGFGGDGKAYWGVIRVRSAFNGLPRWELTNDNPRNMPTRRYEGAVIDGDRLIRLRTIKGPLVAESMVDGKELMVFDEIPIANNTESVRIPATTGGGVDAMVIIEGRTLYVANGNTLSAVNADTGKLLWRFTADAGVYLGFPCIDRKSGTLAIALGPLGMASGRQTHFRAVEYRGFDAVTGAQRWVTPNPISDFIASMATLDGSVYVATAGHLGSSVLSMIGIDARTGVVRWKQLDLPIGMSGTMMLFPDRGYIGRSALSGFDLSDGRHLGRFSIGNSRCDVPRASASTINNFGHYLDVSDPAQVIWDRNEIVRNSCGGSAVPAYGLRFAADNRCGCFEAIRGLVAVSHLPVPPRSPDAQRLMKGPAFSRPLQADAPGGWPSFLGDDRRAGAGGPIKTDKPTQRWKVQVATAPKNGLIPNDWRVGDQWNGAITPPTIANGKVYVAETAGQRLVCLDAETGKELWSFYAESRIDGPPRLTRGRAVFGSRDGFVYCLDASDGALAWRFQAAPNRRMIMAYSQLESPWPVYGAVPVVGTTVLANAGRHPEADGGIALWGLDLATGNPMWQRTLDRSRKAASVPWTGDKYTVPKAQFEPLFEANKIANNVMVADKTVFLVGGKRLRVADGQDIEAHEEFFMMPGWGQIASPVRRPSQLSLDGPGGWGAQWGILDDKLYGYKMVEGKLTKGGKPGVWGRPICVTKDRIVIQQYASGHGGLGPLWCYPLSAARDSGPYLWEIHERELRPQPVNNPANPTGKKLFMAPAGNSMIVAGERIVMTSTVYAPGARYPTNSPLQIRSLADGKLLHDETLPVPTVDHGLAVADGRLYLSMDDGSLICME